MYAVKFEADVRNGLLKIPEKHKELFNKHIEFIAMVDDEKTNQFLEKSMKHKDIPEESIAMMKMQEESGFVQDLFNDPAEEVWNDL